MYHRDSSGLLKKSLKCVMLSVSEASSSCIRPVLLIRSLHRDYNVQ